jgi:aspartyl-tRNA(Asn)/glutamyl-tRNA(Gln) amidotransferase subunit A
MHRDRLRISGDKYGNNIRRRLLTGSLIPSQVLQKAVRLRAIFRAEWLALFSRYDVVLSPTMARPAEKISYIDNGIKSLEEAERKFTKGRNQRHPAAIAGTPALSVPCGVSSLGLPIGLQIMTNSFDEQTAFVVGHAYQRVTKWHTLRPPIADVLSSAAT